MADRHVTHSGKNHEGDITALCNPGESWSPRLKADAIRDIDGNVHTYFVTGTQGRIEIRVVNDRGGKYLRTDPDKTRRNNLDDLPDCHEQPNVPKDPRPGPPNPPRPPKDRPVGAY